MCILYTFCILKYKLFVSCNLFILCFCSLSVASWFLEQTKKTEQNKLFVRRFNILPDLMSFPSMWRVWRWISSCFSRSLKSHSALKSTLRTALYIKYFPVLLSSILFSGTVQHPRELGGLPFSSPLADRCCCIWVAGAGTCTRCPSLSSPSLPPSLPPSPPDTMWTDVLPVPFFPVPLRPVGAVAAAPCAEPFLHHLLKSKPRRLARTAGILALIKLHYC